MQRARFWAPAILVTILLAFAGDAKARGHEPALPPAGAQIQNDDCAVCHEDLTKRFERTAHGVLEKSPRHNLKNSCESCHGPGQAHVESDGDTSKIVGFKGAARKEYNRQCQGCHARTHELTAFGTSTHAKAGLSCADCHKAHDAAERTRLLKAAPNTLCLGCHVQRRADFAKPFHHRVPEGAMRCVDCHQPHGGMERRQLRAASTEEGSCAACHTDKSGPFVFEHAGLRIRECQACHEPHGSVNAKMLVRATVRSLCLECHTTGRGMLAAQPPSFHDVRSPRYQNCTTCHVRIHGSNTSALFLQ